MIQKIELKDKRIEKAITAYIQANDVGEREGAVMLKFDKESPDLFFLGYMVYGEGLTSNPPSHYALIGRKLVLVYTGFESYITYVNASFKSLLKDSKGMFPPEGGLIIEPTYWRVVLSAEEFEKLDIHQLPY